MHKALHKTDVMATGFRSSFGRNLQGDLRDVDSCVASVDGRHFGDSVTMAGSDIAHISVCAVSRQNLVYRVVGSVETARVPLPCRIFSIPNVLLYPSGYKPTVNKPSQNIHVLDHPRFEFNTWKTSHKARTRRLAIIVNGYILFTSTYRDRTPKQAHRTRQARFPYLPGVRPK